MLRSKKLRSFMEKVQGSLCVSPRNSVPEEVKKGHFVVHTISDGKLQRFAVELGFLRHPKFLELLEKAQEEFGFEQEGTLVIPCHPNDMRRILK